MKLKTKCAIHRGALECQLAAMPNSVACWFHMNNQVLFPRDREPVEERTHLYEFKELLRERQGNVCAICGYRFYGNQDVEVEHLHPLSAGGKNSIENLGLVHAKCNYAKHDALLHDPEIRVRLAAIDKHFVDGENRKRALTPAEEKIACQRYEDGEGTVELGAFFGVSTTCITRILVRHGIAMRDNQAAHGVSFTERQEKDICERYAAGEILDSISESFEVSNPTIVKVLRKHGVETRPRRSRKTGSKAGKRSLPKVLGWGKRRCSGQVLRGKRRLHHERSEKERSENPHPIGIGASGVPERDPQRSQGSHRRTRGGNPIEAEVRRNLGKPCQSLRRLQGHHRQRPEPLGITWGQVHPAPVPFPH